MDYKMDYKFDYTHQETYIKITTLDIYRNFTLIVL